MRLMLLVFMLLNVTGCAILAEIEKSRPITKDTVDYNTLCRKHGMFVDYRWIKGTFYYKCSDGHMGKLTPRG